MDRLNNLTIGIDARTLDVRGGSRNYLINLLKNLPNRGCVILFGVNKFEDYRCVPAPLDQRNPLFRLIWENLLLPIALYRNRVDIFHGAKGVLPLISPCPKVITVHDLIPMKDFASSPFLDWLYWNTVGRYSVYLADSIIAVSNSTKNDLISLLNVDAKKIQVIYEAYDKLIYNKKSDLAIHDGLGDEVARDIREKISDKKILLNVNTIQPRKNLKNLIKAFNLIAPIYPDLILLICGQKGWKYENIFLEHLQSPYSNRIFFFHNLSNRAIVNLYSLADVFIYPSFYEGFGLPILEAQACGVPVITSTTSCMPEVAGDGAILIEPANIGDIARGINSILSNQNLRDALVAKGLANLERFSWNKCALETVEVYRRTYATA